MAIFKRCLQRLRHSVSSARLVQRLIAILFVAIVCATAFNAKKFSSHKDAKISCVKNHKIVLSLDSFGAPPDILSIPLSHAVSYDKIPFLEFVSNNEKWKTTALYSESVGDLMAELSTGHLKDPTPLVAFVQDATGGEYFLIVDKSGQSSIQSLQSLLSEWGKEKYLGLKAPSAFHIKLFKPSLNDSEESSSPKA
jgi:hypothetical protein